MRPTKAQYMLQLACVVASRGTCDRKRVGCVIADEEGHILATGYNGSAPGAPHCSESGHLMVDGRCVRTVHAESNAIGHAARSGTRLYGSIAYVTMHPCVECAKMLEAAGVKRVVYLEDYRGHDLVHEVAPNMVFSKFSESAPWFTPVVKHPGKLVVIEGIDGSGKTTVAMELANALNAVYLGEPGGTEFGDKIRSAMCDNATRPCGIALTHAFAAARAQLFYENEHILASGDTIVSDRSFISSMVYQGSGALLVNEPLLNSHGFWPDYILLLTIDPKVAVDRANRGTSNPAGYDSDSVERFNHRQKDYARVCADVAKQCGAKFMCCNTNYRSTDLVVSDILSFIESGR